MKETWEKNSSIEQIDIDHFDQTHEDLLKDDDVYLHLLRLACGLDSVVVGKQEFMKIVKSLDEAKKF